MSDYNPTPFQSVIDIEALVTLHYFEYTKDLDFKGESHDFWELAFIDKGEAQIRGDSQMYCLKKDECILHPPMEFHTVKASGNQPLNLVVVTFICHSPALYGLADSIWHLEDSGKAHLSQILLEARRTYSTPFHVPDIAGLCRRETATCCGSEQLVKLHLEMLLIGLLRKKTAEFAANEYQPSVRVKTSSPVVNRAIHFMESQLQSQITIDEICRNVLVGRSYLHEQFQETLSCGVLAYFGRMKMEFAKQLIRENSLNITQVAEILGFSSVHYFSKRFKQITGMSPSQYQSSVQAISEQVTGSQKSSTD